MTVQILANGGRVGGVKIENCAIFGREHKVRFFTSDRTSPPNNNTHRSSCPTCDALPRRPAPTQFFEACSNFGQRRKDGPGDMLKIFATFGKERKVRFLKKLTEHPHPITTLIGFLVLLATLPPPLPAPTQKSDKPAPTHFLKAVQNLANEERMGQAKF